MRSVKLRPLVMLAGLCSWTLLTGCGGSSVVDVVLTPVTGKVTANGEPLSGAMITYAPYGQQIGKPAYGMTDTDGNYELNFVDGRTGCPPGSYLVTISKFAQPDGSPFPADMPAEQQTAVGMEHIPPEYSSPTQTKLLAEVKTETETIPFEISLKKK